MSHSFSPPLAGRQRGLFSPIYCLVAVKLCSSSLRPVSQYWGSFHTMRSPLTCRHWASSSSSITVQVVLLRAGVPSLSVSSLVSSNSLYSPFVSCTWGLRLALCPSLTDPRRVVYFFQFIQLFTCLDKVVTSKRLTWANGNSPFLVLCWWILVFNFLLLRNNVTTSILIYVSFKILGTYECCPENI